MNPRNAYLLTRPEHYQWVTDRINKIKEEHMEPESKSINILSSRGDSLRCVGTVWGFRAFNEPTHHFAKSSKEALYFCDDPIIAEELEDKLIFEVTS